MKMRKTIVLMIAATVLSCLGPSPAIAEVSWFGDIDPTAPTTWDADTAAYIGKTGFGTLDITGGSNILSRIGHLGYELGSTGEITIDGVGSTWTNDLSLYVGYYGSGVLNIINGGSVSNNPGHSNTGYIGYESGSTGEITVDGIGSTWTSDSHLRVGGYGSGTLDITNGGAVSNNHGYIGTNIGSTGEVTVDGTGSTWTNENTLFVGDDGNGVLNITGGGAVSSGGGLIGTWTDGVVTVDGVGSTWTNNEHLYVGYYGSGVLNITNGGEVIVEKDTLVAYGIGSSGTIHFDNGTLTTGGLRFAIDDLTGTGTINTGGLVSDLDLVFDATHGLNQTLSINDNSGQNITVNLSVDGSGSMGAGYNGVAGTLSISDGVVVESTYGKIYTHSTVTVDGAGSRWSSSRGLAIYNGTMSITNGGAVSNEGGNIGWSILTTNAEVTVDGIGSTWINNDYLRVGRNGADGVLNITGGGLVSVAGVLIIDPYGDGDDFINMATGGMLALDGGEDASGSLLEFLELVDGTDAIRYWDDSLESWNDITNATLDEDYTLSYIIEGNLAGFTILTVMAVPEPGTLVLLGFGGVVMLRRKRR